MNLFTLYNCYYSTIFKKCECRNGVYVLPILHTAAMTNRASKEHKKDENVLLKIKNRQNHFSSYVSSLSCIQKMDSHRNYLFTSSSKTGAIGSSQP